MTSCNMEERTSFEQALLDWLNNGGKQAIREASERARKTSAHFAKDSSPSWETFFHTYGQSVSFAATINSTPDSNALREALGSIANMPDIRVAREETGFEMRDIARAALLSSDPGRVE